MKKRGKIELAPGSLIPTNRAFWESAFTKLAEARAAIQEMDAARDKVGFEDGWSRFVDSLQESWTSFYDEGKTISTKFQPWAGDKEVELMNDPLLLYLRKARDQSQHGRITLDWGAENLQIAPGFSGHIQTLKVFGDGTFEVEATPLGKTNNEVKLVHSVGDPTLPKFIDKRSGKEYAPPPEYQSPLDAAQFGIDYYQSIYREAAERFKG